MNRHNLPLARHAATDTSPIGWGNDCTQFKLSHKPAWLASIEEGDSIINTTLLLSPKLHLIPYNMVNYCTGTRHLTLHMIYKLVSAQHTHTVECLCCFVDYYHFILHARTNKAEHTHIQS